MALTAPAPLAPQHDCSAFDCGNAELSDWLRQRAQDSQAMHGSRCFAVCDGSRIAAFYAWAAASVERRNVRGSIRRDMPEPVPAVLLGRLAVDCGWQGRGLGADLLQGTPRCVPCERLMKSARVVLCHAIDEAAHQFYLHHGFVGSTFDPLTVMLDLRKVEAELRS